MRMTTGFRIIAVWGVIILLGFVVKLFHILSSVFIIIGFSGLASYVVNEFYFRNIRTPFNILLLVLSLIFLNVLLLGAYLNNGYPINQRGVLVYGIVFFICFLYYWLSNNSDSSNINDC